ncbi:MAG: hypothetical protein SGI74_08105 [Oligoflexia bacterium]|nr:hypothetical protein [Oligoflexia bacterium]
MKTKFFTTGLLFVFLLSINAFANGIENAPPAFSINGGKAIYVDFKDAKYEIVYDLKNKTAVATSTINFQSFEEGMPIFDSVAEPVSVSIDGKSVIQGLISDPQSQTKMRLVKQSFAPGMHKMVVVTNLAPTFATNGVRNLFAMTDLDDRGYLEKYLPANLEYDQVGMTFTIDILGIQGEQDFFTNGQLSKLKDSKWMIEFPEYFTSSSLYFHTAPKGQFHLKDFNIASMDGRSLPVRVYGESLDTVNRFIPAIEKSIKGLEVKYGPWRHSSVTVYASSTMGGGMEYSGATVTSMWALNHELTHSYFARGVMPATGNSGWIDEAITTWSDENPGQVSTFNYGSTGMGGRSVYRRYTDGQAYRAGVAFMSFMDFLMQKQGGLNVFLNKLLQTSLRKTITTPQLEAGMSSFVGFSLNKYFKDYIYTGGSPFNRVVKRVENPYHPRLTENDIKALE